MFGTGNESDSGDEGGSQLPASQEKASSQAWREERLEEREGSSPPPEVEAKKRKRSRKEATKTAKVCVCEREKGGREHGSKQKCEVVLYLMNTQLLHSTTSAAQEGKKG